MKHLMDANDDNSLVWTCDLFDIEQYNKERKNTYKWLKKDKQRSAKHYTKTKKIATQTPLKTGSELRCSRKVSSSCSTNGTRRCTLNTNPLINHEWGKDREVLTTCGTYPWSFVKDRKLRTWGTFDFVWKNNL